MHSGEAQDAAFNIRQSLVCSVFNHCQQTFQSFFSVSGNNAAQTEASRDGTFRLNLNTLNCQFFQLILSLKNTNLTISLVLICHILFLTSSCQMKDKHPESTEKWISIEDLSSNLWSIIVFLLIMGHILGNMHQIEVITNWSSRIQKLLPS